MAGYIPTNILKPVRGGFEQNSVMAYINELTDKIDEQDKTIDELEAKLKGNSQDSKLVEQFKNNLAAEKEKTAAAEKMAQENAARMKDATEKAAKLAAALKAEKEGRSADAQQMKQLLQQAQAKARSADEGKLRELQQEIVSLKGEIGQLTSENTKLRNSATASGELSSSVQQLQSELSEQETKLKNAEGDLEKAKGEISEKDKKIKGNRAGEQGKRRKLCSGI